MQHLFKFPVTLTKYARRFDDNTVEVVDRTNAEVIAYSLSDFWLKEEVLASIKNYGGDTVEELNLLINADGLTFAVIQTLDDYYVVDTIPKEWLLHLIAN